MPVTGSANTDLQEIPEHFDRQIRSQQTMLIMHASTLSDLKKDTADFKEDLQNVKANLATHERQVRE